MHTLPLLAKSALKIYEYSHLTSYPQLCEMLAQRFSDKHDRFHTFYQLVALRHGQGGLDAYMVQFLELQTQVPDMSPLDAMDIYLGAWNLQCVYIFWARSMWELWNVRWRCRAFLLTPTGAMWCRLPDAWTLTTTQWT